MSDTGGRKGAVLNNQSARCETAANVRIFIASTPAEWLPAKVLEFSIKETASVPTSVALIHEFNKVIPMPVAAGNRPRTPFSFQRFLIPELCGFSGRAIYLDADMLVFRDIGILWQQDFSGCDLQTVQEGGAGRRGQFSVMLLDCQRLGWRIDQIVEELDAGRLDYAALMYEMRVASHIGRDISPDWNSLEHYEAGKTSLLHFTDMTRQPWVSIANPFGELWIKCLRRALDCQFITREDLVREVLAGHVRPSLLRQIDECADEPALISKEMRKADLGFSPPYRKLLAGSSTWALCRAWVLRGIRHVYYLTRWFRLFSRD